LLIILLIVSPIVVFEDKGPVFYNSMRLGKNGKLFKLFKIRSMKMNSPDIRIIDGSTFNSEDDPRLTKIGKFLRKTSIDETPQIINIIKGEMSFIGPRPDLPEALLVYSNKQKNKLDVKPGITGYSQAFYRNSICSKEKFTNDIYYVNHISLKLDISILFNTLKNVIFQKSVFLRNDDLLDMGGNHDKGRKNPVDSFK
jgi:lipopolysaccharide/colanic/teichoic acid biosynthesis glycosyltransferase